LGAYFEVWWRLFEEPVQLVQSFWQPNGSLNFDGSITNHGASGNQRLGLQTSFSEKSRRQLSAAECRNRTAQFN